MSNARTIHTLLGVVKTNCGGKARRHHTRNRITRKPRRLVLTRIPLDALAEIDALAARRGETRGEAIGRIVREARAAALSGKGVEA